MQHVKSGLVTYDEALKHVSNPDDFALRFRGIASTSDGTWDDFEGDAETATSRPDEARGGRPAAGAEDGRRGLHRALLARAAPLGRLAGRASVMLAGSSPRRVRRVGAALRPRDPRDASSSFFETKGHARVAERLARAERPDAALHERRHGAVQARLHGRGERARTSAPPPRRSACASRASTTISRTSAAAAPPHLLRDARELLLRRLLQAGGDRVRLGARDRALRARPEPPRGHGVPRGRRGRARSGSEEIGVPARADLPARRGRQLLVDGRHRPVRPVHRDLLRPRRPSRASQTTTRPSDSGRFLEFWNLVFMQFDRDAQRHADAAAEAVGRHGRRARAHDAGARRAEAATTTPICSRRSSRAPRSCRA